jgi:CheY-like chemotaxis protein
MAKILVVDDDPHILLLIRRLLTLNGHSVDQATNGEVALELIGERDYDLVLMDQSMPSLTGIETVSIIRTNRRFDALKILMLSGGSMAGTVDDAYAAGVDGYILKPFAADKVLAKVSGALA